MEGETSFWRVFPETSSKFRAKTPFRAAQWRADASCEAAVENRASKWPANVRAKFSAVKHLAAAHRKGWSVLTSSRFRRAGSYTSRDRRWRSLRRQRIAKQPGSVPFELLEPREESAARRSTLRTTRGMASARLAAESRDGSTYGRDSTLAGETAPFVTAGRGSADLGAVAQLELVKAPNEDAPLSTG
jgi:hypothetical protein